MSQMQEPVGYATTWGDRLRRIRLTLGMDQAEFSDVLGLSKPTVARYELMPQPPRGRRMVEAVVQVAIGVPAAEFLREFDVKPTGYGSGVSGVSVLWARFRPGRAA